jgi:Icc-related predicted phosphoesterase
MSEGYRLCCISDLHGRLPEIPDCDTVLLAGDIVPPSCHDPDLGRAWLETNFRSWVHALAERGIDLIGVAGNHDFVFEKHSEYFRNRIPSVWDYLEHEGMWQWGIGHIWGTPYQPEFHDWAFNRREDELERLWDAIHVKTDVLIVHGPPRGYGDRTPAGEHVGSPSLTRWIAKNKPRLVVTGHIHSDYGIHRLGETLVVNAALTDEDYRLVNRPILVDLFDDRLEPVE